MRLIDLTLVLASTGVFALPPLTSDSLVNEHMAQSCQDLPNGSSGFDCSPFPEHDLGPNFVKRQDEMDDRGDSFDSDDEEDSDDDDSDEEESNEMSTVSLKGDQSHVWNPIWGHGWDWGYPRRHEWRHGYYGGRGPWYGGHGHGPWYRGGPYGRGRYGWWW